MAIRMRTAAVSFTPSPMPMRRGPPTAATRSGGSSSPRSTSILRSREDWTDGTPVPAIREAQEAIRRADHILFFYPLWLGDVPALLKAFLEQVARPGFALAEGTMPRPLLKGRSARLVVTMGMPAFFYRFYYGAHSVKSFERNILRLAGIAPVAHTLIGGVEGEPETRTRWLATMRDLGWGGV